MPTHRLSRAVRTPSAALAILPGPAATALGARPANDACATPQSVTGTGFFIVDGRQATAVLKGKTTPGARGTRATQPYYNGLWYC